MLMLAVFELGFKSMVWLTSQMLAVAIYEVFTEEVPRREPGNELADPVQLKVASMLSPG